ncbi:MAG: hypothetical protein AB7O52_12605 [Planctomycetota bacterium]
MLVSGMSTNDYTQILDGIAQSSRLVAERRGEHAAALWSVNNFLTGLAKGLVVYRDSKPLTEKEGGLLLISPTPAPAGAHPAAGAHPEGPVGWGVFIEVDGQVLVAHEAPPTLVVAAVRRLPDFLAAYGKQLQAAAGSEHTVSQAKRFVAATCEHAS